MEQALPLYMESGTSGTLTWREDGALVHLHLRAEDAGAGLCRAYLCGEGGRFDLGTLLPDGAGGLYLDRSCARALLERARAWPPLRAQTEVSFAFRGAGEALWRAEPEPARLTDDAVLRAALRGVARARVRRLGELTLLALPFEGVFPLEPLFCLARVARVEGRRCAVFAFDSAGTPALPPKDFV